MLDQKEPKNPELLIVLLPYLNPLKQFDLLLIVLFILFLSDKHENESKWGILLKTM